MKIIGLIIGCFLYPSGDSLLPVTQNVEFLYQMIQEQTEDLLSETLELGVADESYEDLIEDYLYYLEHPINLNSEEVVHLEEIGLLSAFQLEALRNYRRQFGDLLFLGELPMVEGFTEAVTAVIAPLVYLGKSEKEQEFEQPSLGRMLLRGKHQMTVNYAEKFGGEPHEDYLGSPRKIQLKYTYHYKQKLRFGVVTEKDAGEPLFFDFIGAHCYLTDLRLTQDANRHNGLVVKELALGDYQLGFGQGLTLWSGMSFGKASGGSSAMRRAAGVKPKASSGEGKFFRGAATTLKYHDCYATGFYSIRNIDATVSLADSLDEPELVSTLQESGYHRTPNELEKRNAIQQQVFGGHLCYAGPNLEIGYTLYHLRLETPLELKPSKYNQFYFQGDRLTDMGLDFRWLNGKTAFFGELSRSDNGAYAGLVGMTVKPKGYIDFSLLYRNYDKRYQNLFNGAFGESSRGQGEEGVYLGLHCTPIPQWDLLVYGDFFRLNWLTSQVYNPSWGQEYSLKLSHQISNTASMQLRFKSKTKMKNSTDDHVFAYYPIFYTKRSLNFQISYGITADLTFSDKVAYTHYVNDDGADSRGVFVCHDIAYKPQQPFSLTFRYALFDSDDYYSRISVYENDVLGAFSIPSLYGLGSRIYLLGKLTLFGSLSLYSRVGINVLSEGTKTDFKLEMVWKN